MIQILYEKEILSVALSKEIPSSWIKAIIAQESAWNPYALKYEPDFPYFLNPEHYAQLLNITRVTEMECQRFSWGLGQIMGALARQLGHEQEMGLLFDPATNILLIGKYLRQLSEGNKPPERVFAEYNAGPGVKPIAGKYPNQNYVDSVMNHMKEYT